jgi:tRNA pseudouridine65 synthase
MPIPESSGDIRIVRLDDQFVVIDKPPAMLTHANSFDRHSPTVVMVMGSRLGSAVYNVHRLDRMTTGAMVLARTADAASELSRQFRDREVEKRYVAIVRGHLDDAGTIDHPIASASHGDRQEARTDYLTLGRGRLDEPIGRYSESWFSLVELRLHTGRSHQARRHLHRIDHPVIGDRKHGDKAYNRAVAALLGEKHLFLRANGLSFRHPVHGETVTVHLSLPEVWLRFLNMMGLEPPDAQPIGTSVS